MTRAFHQPQTGARLDPFLQMLQKQEAAAFSRTHRELQFCFANSAAAHQTFGVTPLPRPLTPNMKLTASPPVLRDLQLKCKPPSTTQGKSGLGRFLFTSAHNTLVPFQREAPCRGSGSLTAHPGFPFPSLARPLLCRVSASAHGQGQLLAVPLRWDFSSPSSQEMD